MPVVNLSKISKLRKANMTFRATVCDTLQRATKKQQARLIKRRMNHFKALKEIPFFKRILAKEIPLQIFNTNGAKGMILLGVGFEGNANFRRTVLLIDEQGKTIFWGEKVKGDNRTWAAYRIVEEQTSYTGRKSYNYNEVENVTPQQEQEASEISYHIKKHLKEIAFEPVDMKRMGQIKRFM